MSLIPTDEIAPWTWENRVKRKERELADWRGLAGKVKPLVESGQTDAARKIVADSRPPEAPKQSPQMKAVAERLKSALSEMQSRPAGGIRASGRAEGGKPEADAFRSAVQSGLSKVGKAASIAGGEIASGARSNVGNLASAKDWALSEDPLRLNDIPGSVTAQQKVQRANPVRRYAGLPAEPTRAEVTGEDRSQGLSNAARVGMATVSGEQFVNNLAGKDVTSGLPTPVRYGIESFAAPVNLLSVGGAGIAAKAGGAGLKGVGAAVARRFVLEGSADLAGRVAGEQAMKALPEDTPMPLKVGTALGAGILAGGATYKVGEKVLDAAPGAARGLKAGVDAQGGLASESGQFSMGRPKDITADMPYEGRKVIPDSRAASLDLNGDQVVNARGDVIGAIRSAVGIDLGGRQIPTKGFYFDAAGGTGVGHRLYGETPEDIIESLRFARTDNRYGAAADAFSAPAPLANERLWFHSTRDMAYDLPDEAKSVGGATGITQGPGVYLAADPSKSAGRYGNRTFVTEFDGNVLDLTRKMGPDDALFEGGPTWRDYAQRVADRLNKAGIMVKGEGDIAAAEAAYDNAVKQYGKTSLQARKALDALSRPETWKYGPNRPVTGDDLLRHNPNSAIPFVQADMKTAGSAYALRDDIAANVAELVRRGPQPVSRETYQSLVGRFAGTPEGWSDSAKALINDEFANNGVDAVFHHSPRADGDVLIVLNGEKARVLGDVKDVKEGLKGKTWGELKKNIAKATKAAQDFEIQDTGDPRGLKAVFVREANGRWQQYASGYVRQLDNGKWAASLGADTLVGSNFESAEEAAKQFLRGAAGASMTEYGYIRPQLATSAAGAAAGGLYGATNPEQGPYGDRVSSALLYAGLGALAGAVAGKGVDLYARRGQGYVPPITTPSGAKMVISDVGTDGITAAIVTKASVDRGPGALASRYAPVRKLKGMLAPSAGMDAEVLYPLRASSGVRAQLQTQFQTTMKPALDRLQAAMKAAPARYLGDVTGLNDGQKRLIGTLPDIMERPSAYEIAPQLRQAIDSFAVTQWNDVTDVARSKYAVDVLPYMADREAGYAFVPHMTAADVSDDALAAASRGASFSAGRGTKERAYATLFERVGRHPEWKPELDMETLTQRHLTGMALNAQDQTFKIGTGGLRKVEVLDITHPGLVAAKDDAVKDAASLRARVNTAIRQAGGLGDEVDELDKVLNEFDRGMPQGGMRPLARTGTALRQSEGLVEGKRAETVARKMTGGGPVRVKVPPTGEALLQADAMDRVVNKFKPLIPDDVSEVAKLDTAMRRTEKRIQLLSSRQGVKVQGLAKLQADLAVAKDHLDTLRQRYRTAGIPEDQYVQSTATHLYHSPEVAQSIDRLRAPVSGPLKGISEVVDEIRAWHLAGDGSPLTIQGQLAVTSDPVNAKHAVQWLFGKGNDPSNELQRIAHTEADDVAQYTMATSRPFGQQTLELSVQQGKRGVARIPGAARLENKMFAAVEIGQFRGWQRDRDMLMQMHPGMSPDVAANEAARAWEKIIPSLSGAERGVSPGRAAVERIALTSTSFMASPALMVKDATSGWARLLRAVAQTHDVGLAVRTIPGRELIAMKRTMLMAGTMTTIAAATASLSAESRGLSQEEAIKRAVLPWGGTGWSPSGDWMTLQLGEGRRIGLGGPVRGFVKALAPDRDGVPFAGVKDWAYNKVNQPTRALLDLRENKDWRGNEIATSDNGLARLFQQSAYALESIVPITLGEAMSQARTGELGWSNTLTGVGAQFAGVNYNPPSPSERLHQIARETYGKEFWDLAPSEKAAIKADHSSLWLNYVAGASDMVRAAEQAKQDFLTQQATADADLLAGKIALQDWAEGLDDRRNQLIGADRVIYADLEKGGKRNPVLDSYYAAIDAANVNGSVDWTKVDAYVGGLSRQDQQYIKDNTGLTQTPLTRLRKTLQGDYYSLPRYRGYTAAEAGQVDDYYDDILNLVGTGASKGRKLAAARQVAGDADPKVLKALRMKILGYLDDTADRERWRRQHPESALIVSRGRMSAAQIAAIQAAV